MNGREALAKLLIMMSQAAGQTQRPERPRGKVITPSDEPQKIHYGVNGYAKKQRKKKHRRRS